jgi:hypothetical protein
MVLLMVDAIYSTIGQAAKATGGIATQSGFSVITAI